MSTNKKRLPAAHTPTPVRRGGLGRGLASLIPTGASKPTLGHGAADVILGGVAAERGGDLKTSKEVDSPRSPEEQKKPTIAQNQGLRQGTTNVSTDNADVENIKRDIDGNLETGVESERLTPVEGAQYAEIPLDRIMTNPKQPRQVFDEQPLEELIHSIKEFGLLQPIVVRPYEGSADASSERADYDYQLIMGERRLRASREAGLDHIPAIIRHTDNDAMLRDALLENIHRVQLNPLEEAAAYQQLLEEFGVTQAELAQRIGRSRPVITNMIRLLQLPVSVQYKVGAGVLSAGHARAILSIKGRPDLQELLAQRVVAEGLSVRMTEEAALLMNRDQGVEKKRKKKNSYEQPEYVNHWAESVADALETKVVVQMGKKKGKIIVEFGDQDDFNRITDLLNFRSEG